MANKKKEYVNENVEITEKVDEKKTSKKAKGFKVRKDLGFEKRNYFIEGKKVLLIAGEEIDEETYNLFNDYCKKTFFDKSS